MGPADAVRRMRAKLQTEEGKEIYHQRKRTVESAFGHLFKGSLIGGDKVS